MGQFPVRLARVRLKRALHPIHAPSLTWNFFCPKVFCLDFVCLTFPTQSRDAHQSLGAATAAAPAAHGVSKGCICAAGELFGFFAGNCWEIAFLDLSNGWLRGKILSAELPKHFVTTSEPVEQEIWLKHKKNHKNNQISEKIENSWSHNADIAK